MLNAWAKQPIYVLLVAVLVALSLITVLFHVTGTPVVELKDVAKALAVVAAMLLARSQVTPSGTVAGAATAIATKLDEGDVGAAKAQAAALARKVDPSGKKSVPPPAP